MLETIQKRDKAVRIFLGMFVGIIALGMLSYMLPGSLTDPSASVDAVVEVDGRAITSLDVRNQLQRLAAGRPIPKPLESLYARQVLDQILMERMMEVEAERMGIQVTRQEQAERIRKLLPSAATGDMDRYAQEVQERAQMSVPEFEELIRKSMLQEKFAAIVTDGITVSPGEVDLEFRRRNEKIKIEYVLVKPGELEQKILVSDAELAAFFEKNKSGYQVPERRSVRFALLDLAQLRQRVSVSDDKLRAYYLEHLDRFRVHNRAQVSRILFNTLGKTDAEVEEIRKKAEDVLRKAKSGAKFEDLARQYSEHTATKDKGGDLGWILERQTEAEFEKAAFTLPKGAISGLVKTQIGFDIIKVVDRETARTQSFEEVRASLQPIVAGEESDRLASEAADKMASAVRQSTTRTIEDMARDFGMTLGQAGPAAVREPLGELSSSPELDDALFRLKQGELSPPIRLDRGYIILSLSKIEPVHQGTLAEVRQRVLAAFRQQKSAELARSRAEELVQRAKAGATLAASAKALGFASKTSESFAATGTIPDIGSAKPLSAAFSLAEGSLGPATSLGANWIAYRVVARGGVKPEDLARQMKEVQEQVLQNKRGLAYEAFRSELKTRMTKEGKIKYNDENLKRLTNPSGS